MGTPEHREEMKKRARERWAREKHKYRKPKVEEKRAVGDAPPLPKNLPITWQVPDDLHDLLGETLTLNADWNTWVMFHVRRQSELSKITMQQYKSYYYKLPAMTFQSSLLAHRLDYPIKGAMLLKSYNLRMAAHIARVVHNKAQFELQ